MEKRKKFKLGCSVKTTKEYTKQLTTLKSFKGIIVDYEPFSHTYKVRKGNKKYTWIAPEWLEKDYKMLFIMLWLDLKLLFL